MKSSSLKANQTIKTEGPTKATLMWWATYSLSQFAICVLSCAKGFLEQKSIFQPSSTSFLWCGQPLDATLGFDTQWMARWLDFVCRCGHPGLSNQTCSLCRKCSVGFLLIKTLKKRAHQLLHTLKHASCNSTWVVLDSIYIHYGQIELVLSVGGLLVGHTK